jgi:tetratricopeptide (TPR) repeat protein
MNTHTVSARCWLPLVLFATTCALCLCVYLPALRGPFVFDDIFEIESNPALGSLWPPFKAMISPGGFPSRPLPYYSFAVSRALHGLDPLGWKLTNLAIHLLNGALVWLVIKRLPRLDASTGEAWAAATVWLVHPLCTQPVAYIYQRMELLGATAILAALACFLSFRSGGGLAATVAVSAIGMLCKETAAAIPPLIALTDWLLVNWRPDRPWASLWVTVRQRWPFYACLFATLGVAACLVAIQSGSYREFTAPVWSPLAYASTQPLIILHYLRLTAWPAGQCFDYGWPAASNSLTIAGGFTALACTIAVAFRCVSRQPLAAYAIVSFLLLLAPSSSVVPVNDICVEHRMYLPLVVPVTAGVITVGRHVSGLHHGSMLRRVLLVMVLAAEVAVASSRTAVYESMIALWSDTAAKVPRNQRALLWKGIALSDAGRDEEAFSTFAATIAADPENPVCARAHAFRAAMLGKAGDYPGALAEASRAVALNPADSIGWNNLSQALRAVGRFEDATAAAEKAADGRRH